MTILVALFFAPPETAGCLWERAVTAPAVLDTVPDEYDSDSSNCLGYSIN